MTQAVQDARGGAPGVLAEPVGVLAEPVGDLRTGPLGVLADLVAEGGVVILSGAGLSTESGIPEGETGNTRFPRSRRARALASNLSLTRALGELG